MDRSSILFESWPDYLYGGKPAADTGFGAFLDPDTSWGRKLTLLDSDHSGFAASASASTAVLGGSLTVTYSGAQTGTNEYVSAMLCKADGTPCSYASVTPDASGSGAWNMTLPAAIAEGSYVLRVFSEQRNGDYGEDFASPFVNIPLTIKLPGKGTESDPWQIPSAEAWDGLAAAVAGGRSTRAKYFRLTADIDVNTMMGTSEYPFWGQFDGAGHTMNLELADTEYTAPFRYVSDATFKHLRVKGRVFAHGDGGSGLVGSAVSGCTVTDCVVDVDIVARAGGGHSGFVAMCGGTVSVTGCAFTGSITGANSGYCAGFLGWNGSTATDCVYDGAMATGSASNDFIRTNNSAANCYDMNLDGIDRVKGRQAYAVTADAGVTLDFGEPTAAYPTSGITAYDTGLVYNGVFCAGEGESVTLGLTADAPEGFAAQYTASAGALTETDGAWTLAMPEEDVVICAAFTPVFGTPDFTLPAYVTAIGDNAFEGVAATVVDIPDGCASIGDYAFKNCPNLAQIRIPASVETIGADIFSGCANIVYVFGAADSAAQAYCQDPAHNCVFVAE